MVFAEFVSEIWLTKVKYLALKRLVGKERSYDSYRSNRRYAYENS